MTEEERDKKLEELSNALDELEALLAENGITLDDPIDDDDEYYATYCEVDTRELRQLIEECCNMAREIKISNTTKPLI